MRLLFSEHIISKKSIWTYIVNFNRNFQVLCGRYADNAINIEI